MVKSLGPFPFWSPMMRCYVEAWVFSLRSRTVQPTTNDPRGFSHWFIIRSYLVTFRMRGKENCWSKNSLQINGYICSWNRSLNLIFLPRCRGKGCTLNSSSDTTREGLCSPSGQLISVCYSTHLLLKYMKWSVSCGDAATIMNAQEHQNDSNEYLRRLTQ